MIEMREIRGRIRDAVSSLDQVDTCLAELAESLPLSSHASEMWRSRIPKSFTTHLYAVLEVVRSDCIQDAMKTLQHAVRQSDTTLRDEFLHQETRR